MNILAAMILTVVFMRVCPQSGAGGIGEPCQISDPCSDGNAECISNVCKCKTGFFDDAGTCEHKAEIGQRCSQPDRCFDGNAECVSNVCKCKTGFFNDAGTCERKAAIGQLCSQSDHCSDGNAECISNVCKCKTGFFNNAGACERNRLLRESCDSIRKCDDFNAACSNATSVCLCKDTHYEDTKSVCKERSAVGEVCSPIILCRSPNAQCVEGRCSCPETNFHISKFDCLPDAYSQQQKQGFTAAVVIASLGTAVLPAIAIVIYKTATSPKFSKANNKEHRKRSDQANTVYMI